MAIYVIGVNHKTAPIALRERVHFAVDKLSLYLQDLLTGGYAKEAVLLSTCNRSELYCEAEDLTRIYQWFIAQTPFTASQMAPYLYNFQDEKAISHIMEVACGLDSMVLGEPQILGQMKEAFSESCAALAVGPAFQRLFQQIFSVAKEIRTTTAVGACPVSMVSAAVHFVKERCPSFPQAHTVLVGAGDTAQLLMRYLSDQIQTPLTVINRTPEAAYLASRQYGAKVCGLEGLSQQLEKADVVFTMTGSAIPIINQPLVSQTLSKRQGRRLILVDIAVPRDVEPAVGELDGVDLYCIDDLKSIIETNRQGREHAAHKARELISAQSKQVMAAYQSFDHVAYTIRVYRNQIEAICQQEMLKAQQALRRGRDPQMVLQTFAQAYTNKLLHVPSVQLRQAGIEGRLELLQFAKQLFALPDLEVEPV